VVLSSRNCNEEDRIKERGSGSENKPVGIKFAPGRNMFIKIGRTIQQLVK
jgi:hypothetical protein